MEEFISLKQLATELGLDRSNTRKYVLKSGIRPHKRRTPDSGGQLVPELDPRRVKLGFAEDVAARLAQHKTVAPTAMLVKCWPCKRSWERTAIDCLACSGCRLILNEVFEYEDVEELVARGDQFFALLPAPDQRSQLSECSPHNT